MGQTNFEFLLDFEHEADAKAMEKRLRQLSEECRGELAPLMEALLKADQVGDEDISVDGVQREQASVYLLAYGGRSAQPPFDAAAEFHKLGCHRSYLRAYYEEGEQSCYFLGKKRVGVNAFTVALRGDRDKDVIKQLYLPKGRVQVDAKLLEFEWDSSEYGDYCLMRFETAEGDTFYYKGNSEKLLLLTQDEYAPDVTFFATFEVTYLDADLPPVAAAKRPTQITVKRLNACGGGVSVLRGDNKEFANGAIGIVVKQYFEAYRFDCNLYFATLREDSFLGFSFTQLLKHAAKSKIEQFQAFGLNIWAKPRPPAVSLTVEIPEPQVAVDFHGLAAQVQGFKVNFFSCQKSDSYFCADWATSTAYVEIVVKNDMVKLELNRRLKLCADGKSVEAQYNDFTHNPGLASKADWIDLFELARRDAEAGNVASMAVYAYLLDSRRGWESRPDEARQWRDRAGEAGNGAALLQVGLRLVDGRNSSVGEMEEGLDYFCRAGALGCDRAWDEVEQLLKWRAHLLPSITLEQPPEAGLDRTYWLTDNKDWMRSRRASWKALEPMLKPLYKSKDLARHKKYYLTGELPAIDGFYGGKPHVLNMSLLDLLWLHPSEDPELLQHLRGQCFKQLDFRRRYFHDWQSKHSSALIIRPAQYSEDKGRRYDQRPIENASLYYKILNCNYSDYGYYLHGQFIPFRKPNEGIRELLHLGNWFGHDKLLEPNKRLVLLDAETLEWWYRTLPVDLDFSKESNADALPYMFNTLYRLHHFPNRGIDCPLRDDLGTRLRKMLDERPFCDEFKRLWAYVRDTDFTLKNAWDSRYDPREDWKKHRDKY